MARTLGSRFQAQGNVRVRFVQFRFVQFRFVQFRFVQFRFVQFRSRERDGEPVLGLEDCLQLGGAVEEVLQALVNPEKDVGPQLVAGSVVGDAARNH